MASRVVVLSTTDIFTVMEPRHQRFLRLRDGVEAPHADYGLRAEVVKEPEAEATRFWTTGVLEMALQMGFTVWVVSTRRAVGPHDSWWTTLVPGMYTIMHGPNLGRVWKERILGNFVDRIDEASLETLERQLEGDDSGDTYRTCINAPFLVWALLTGIEWPLLTWEERDFTETGALVEIQRAEPAFWTSGLTELAAQGHIVTGDFFYRQIEAANDVTVVECKETIRALDDPTANTRGEILAPLMARIEESRAQDQVLFDQYSHIRGCGCTGECSC